MNRIYRKVWNKTLGQMVVASEFASSDSSGGLVDQRSSSHRLQALVVAIGLGLAAGIAMPDVQAQSLAIGGTAKCIVLGSADLKDCAVNGDAVASGANAVALGAGAIASGGRSMASGYKASATADDATALGAAAHANAANSVALGANSVADRAGTVSVGSAGSERQITNVAAGTAATDAVNKAQLDAVGVAVGEAQRYFTANGAADGSDDAVASGAGAMAAGVGSQATGAESVAVGSYNVAAGDYASAVGYVNTANGLNSSAMGNFNQVDGDNSSAFGFANFVEGANAVAIGSNNLVSGDYSVALGDTASALAEDAVAIGHDSVASGNSAVAMGWGRRRRPTMRPHRVHWPRQRAINLLPMASWPRHRPSIQRPWAGLPWPLAKWRRHSAMRPKQRAMKVWQWAHQPLLPGIQPPLLVAWHWACSLQRPRVTALPRSVMVHGRWATTPRPSVSAVGPMRRTPRR
jgi:autotransporter adhesin